LSDKQREKVEIVDAELLLDGFFRVEKLRLRHRLISGDWSPLVERFLLRRPDAVCAMVHNTERDCIYLVRQFRPGAYEKDRGWLYELAAGLVDGAESPLEALHREVDEELGFRFQNAQLLHRFFPSPGIISEQVFLYYIQVTDADKVSAGGGLATEHEDLEIIEVPISQLEIFMEANPIVDAKTLIGILRFKEIWRQLQSSNLEYLD
jgi:nudix-type nucleoside diphosphatase (YffH/AdpP family)